MTVDLSHYIMFNECWDVCFLIGYFTINASIGITSHHKAKWVNPILVRFGWFWILEHCMGKTVFGLVKNRAFFFTWCRIPATREVVFIHHSFHPIGFLLRYFLRIALVCQQLFIHCDWSRSDHFPWGFQWCYGYGVWGLNLQILSGSG